MTDGFLYPGEANPADGKLRDPTVPTGRLATADGNVGLPFAAVGAVAVTVTADGSIVLPFGVTAAGAITVTADGAIGLPFSVSGDGSITLGTATGDSNVVLPFTVSGDATAEQPAPIIVLPPSGGNYGGAGQEWYWVRTLEQGKPKVRIRRRHTPQVARQAAAAVTVRGIRPPGKVPVGSVFDLPFDETAEIAELEELVNVLHLVP